MPIIGLIAALVPILQGLIGGTAFGVVLAGLSFTQWAGLAGAIAGVIVNEPQIEADLRMIHSIFNVLIDDIKAHGPDVAARNAHMQWGASDPDTFDPWQGGPPHGWA